MHPRSTYDQQAARWKQGFTQKGQGSQDIELALINELCSSQGISSFPSKTALNKLLRNSRQVDQDYVCQLLLEKLRSRMWQARAKSLSVIDSLMTDRLYSEKTSKFFINQRDIFEKLKADNKQVVQARSTKVIEKLEDWEQTFQPTQMTETSFNSMDSSNEIDATPDPSSNSFSFINSPPSPQKGSSFEFLNSESIPEPVDIDPNVIASNNSFVSSEGMTNGISSSDIVDSTFSFMSGNKEAGLTHPLSVASTDFPPVGLPSISPASGFSNVSTPSAEIHDPFAQEAPLTIGNLSIVDNTAETQEEGHIEETEEKEKCRIHDAFEGLLEEDPTESPYTSPPKDAQASSFEGKTFEGPLREVLIEIDVPPGPIGMVLDHSIPSMAVVERFSLLPNGETGILALHPVLCPGCQLVSVNGEDVSLYSLENVGKMLGHTMRQKRSLTFKKTMVGGITANPLTKQAPYTTPSASLNESESKEDITKKAASITIDNPPVFLGQQDALLHPSPTPISNPLSFHSTVTATIPSTSTNGQPLMEELLACENEMNSIEKEVNEIAMASKTQGNRFDIIQGKNSLAQLNGNLEKLTLERIDAVIIGPNTLNTAEIKKFRSHLVHRSESLSDSIQSIARDLHQPTSPPQSNTTCFEFLQSTPATTIESPKTGTGFSFLSQTPTNDTKDTQQPNSNGSSNFNFISQPVHHEQPETKTEEDVQSPTGGSAFSFM